MVNIFDLPQDNVKNDYLEYDKSYREGDGITLLLTTRTAIGYLANIPKSDAEKTFKDAEVEMGKNILASLSTMEDF